MFRAGNEPASLLVRLARRDDDGHLVGDDASARPTRSSGSAGPATLELLVAAPAPFCAVLLPITIATSAIGVYSLASTLLWGRFLFGIPLHLEQPLVFALAITPTIVSIGLLGFLMASVSSSSAPAGRSGTCSSIRSGSSTGLLIPVVDPPRLGEAGLVGARSDVGHAGAQRRRVRRRLPRLRHRMCIALSVVYTVVGALLPRPLPPVGAPTRHPVAHVSRSASPCSAG